MVNDPWWRETILLWAANADASAVVEACLTSGSVESLALAYDCAAEAREVDADLLERLDTLLYAEPSTSSTSDRDVHRKLLAAVRASRSLRHTVTLANGAVICASPVPESLHRLYVEWDGNVATPAQGSTGQSQSTQRRSTGQDDVAEAVGVQALHVEKMVAWVNGLFEDGTAYRLPTRRELADPMTEVVVDLTQRSIWFQDPVAELPVMQLAADADDEEEEERVYAGPRLYVPNAVTHPYLGTPEVRREAIRRDLLTVESVLPFVLSFCLERNPERARVHDFKVGLKRLEKLAVSKTPALEGKTNHIDRALARSRSGDMTQDRELIQLTERVTEFADAVAEFEVFPASPEPVRDLTAMLRGLRPISEAVGQALDIVLTRALQADDVLMLVRDLRTPERGLEDSLAIGRPSQSPRRHEREISGSEFEIAVTALSLLLSLWQPSRNKYRPGQVLTEFYEYLAALFPASAAVEPVIPEETEFALKEIGSLLKKAQWSDYLYPGADNTSDRVTWRILARRLTAVAAKRVASIARQPSLARSHGPALRIGLLAAAAVADQFAEAEIAAKLRGVHSSLVCLETRQHDPSQASEVILLIRT